MIISSKLPIDILIQFTWSILSIPIIFSDINETLRIMFGLPILLFIPGYMLTFLLFPSYKTDKGVDSVERFAISFALSLAIIPIIGMGLNYTPMGLRLIPILISLELFIFITGLIATYRWFKTPSSTRFTFKLNISLPKDKDIPDKVLTIFLIISILSFVIISTYVIFTPFKTNPFTEFYILNSEGTMDEYPTDLAIGENATIKIGIANHEHTTKKYTVEVWLLNQTIKYNEIENKNITVYNHMWHMAKTEIVLDVTPADINKPWKKQWEYDYTFNIFRKGNFKLFFLLFINETQENYADFDYGEMSTQIINNAYLITNLSITVSNLPKIYNISASPSYAVQNGSINISCSIFDIDRLHEVYLNISDPGGYRDNISIINNNTRLRYYCNQTYANVGSYQYYIWANDITDNSSRSSIYRFTITDIPVIPNVWSTKNSTMKGDSLNISCVVYDFEGLSNISLNITNPLGNTENISIIDNRTGDIYYSNRIYEVTGTYTYFIWTRDTVGNTNRSAINQFTIISG
jgi:uncharacterized membrane protein